MEVIDSRRAWRAACDDARRDERVLGLVPTMGALHEGHVSLVTAAAAACDRVAATIFVNPLQFGDASDLVNYPRTLESDLSMLEAAGCDLVFTPSIEEIYPGFPAPVPTSVTVSGAAEGLEGAGRPGHFDGVATVVTLLFSLTGPAKAFFGEKDFQQVAVVRQVVRDLGLPIEVVACPTLRDADGLALSSRNRRLTPEGRRAAGALHAALVAGAEAIQAGSEPAASAAVMEERLASEPMATVSYAEVVDPISLQRTKQRVPGASLRLLVAAEIGGVRLIDNLGAEIPATEGSPD
ncbi:MAG: pantoate--beta-alanine ligase [Actinomycetes bacterium]